ncbi:hypothetical protein KO533_16470 [Shewanella sp. NKUCC05_KAH]|uniref:hypothetical protein n=1 Tax=Shewanella sp. NKUCC05_KAH TaxID=2842126 RepID=UPI001C5BC91C|nr:hypothetical protein [Shewanella sp. NKUCC05_KAH]MBW3528144.1 hypothetical protein [Shewanella sp. NKUCC05_KAH]
MKELAVLASKKLEDVEKFFASYQSAIFFHSSEHIAAGLPPHLAKNIHGNMPLRILDRAPTGYEKEPIPAIEFNQGEMKKYMLEEGGQKIFEFSVQLMYSNFEHFIREALVAHNPERYSGKIVYFGKEKLEELGINIPDEVVSNIIIIRETRNCLVHNSGVWDDKSARKLSKAINGVENNEFQLAIGSSSGEIYKTPVGVSINTALNQTANIKWMTAVLQIFYSEVART